MFHMNGDKTGSPLVLHLIPLYSGVYSHVHLNPGNVLCSASFPSIDPSICYLFLLWVMSVSFVQC